MGTKQTVIFVTTAAVLAGGAIAGLQANGSARAQQAESRAAKHLAKPAARAASAAPAAHATQVARVAKPASKVAAAAPAPAARKPVPMTERFREEMAETSRGEARGGEGNLDLWAQWFYGQRTYPGKSRMSRACG